MSKSDLVIGSVDYKLGEDFSGSPTETGGFLITFSDIDLQRKEVRPLREALKDVAGSLAKTLNLKANAYECLWINTLEEKAAINLRVDLASDAPNKDIPPDQDLFSDTEPYKEATTKFQEDFENLAGEIIQVVRSYKDRADNGEDPEITANPNPSGPHIHCSSDMVARNARHILAKGAKKSGPVDLRIESDNGFRVDLDPISLAPPQTVDSREPEWDGHVEEISDSDHTAVLRVGKKRVEFFFEGEVRQFLCDTQTARQRIWCKFREIDAMIGGAVIEVERALSNVQVIHEQQTLA